MTMEIRLGEVLVIAVIVAAIFIGVLRHPPAPEPNTNTNVNTVTVAKTLADLTRERGELRGHYTPAEFAVLCGVNADTVRRWCTEGLIDAAKVNGAWQISLAARRP